MIGLDTNVVVRYLTQDDPAQAKKATQLMETELTVQNPGFITLMSLVEITWVLESCYHQKPADVLAVIHALLTTKQLYIENADIAYSAWKRCNGVKADFSDAMIVAISEKWGCSRTLSFDKKARVVGMQAI